MENHVPRPRFPRPYFPLPNFPLPSVALACAASRTAYLGFGLLYCFLFLETGIVLVNVRHSHQVCATTMTSLDIFPIIFQASKPLSLMWPRRDARSVNNPPRAVARQACRIHTPKADMQHACLF